MFRFMIVAVICVLLRGPLVAQVAVDLTAESDQVEAGAATRLPPLPTFGPYPYESKPDGEAFEKINPRKAPPVPEAPLLRKGDRLAIIGDSITEQKKYSRIIETYLTVCTPQYEIETRQLGWSGETAERFLKRMDQDCLRFRPTVATLSYGMNDARYRPFDFNNGQWYENHYAAVVQRLKQSGSRVIVGSPGCAGKIAKWVKSKSGTLDEHNQQLCALRDIAMQISFDHHVGFADVYWPMYKARAEFNPKYSTPDKPFRVVGSDGIHPAWAGHVLMAYAYLRAMGLDGKIATIKINYKTGEVTTSDGHRRVGSSDKASSANWWEIESDRFPFCAEGATDDEQSIRAGMTLIPFNQQLNQFQLVVTGLDSPKATVRWGEHEKTFTAADLSAGINLAELFVVNPFTPTFKQVDEAVAAKQAFETTQVKKIFHGKRGKADIELAVTETEAERKVLVDAIREAYHPVRHRIEVIPVR